MQDTSYIPIDGPKHWPSHVRPISVEGLGHLGVDPSNGDLYFDGTRLGTDLRLLTHVRLVASRWRAYN
jgi:hypothetical protein